MNSKERRAYVRRMLNPEFQAKVEIARRKLGNIITANLPHGPYYNEIDDDDLYGMATDSVRLDENARLIQTALLHSGDNGPICHMFYNVFQSIVTTINLRRIPGCHCKNVVRCDKRLVGENEWVLLCSKYHTLSHEYFGQVMVANPDRPDCPCKSAATTTGKLLQMFAL